MFVKTGPVWNAISRPPPGDFAQNVRAQDVAGHQVGRELHPIELEMQRLPQRLDQRRLAHAGQALQQDVPAAQNADQHHAVELLAAEQRLVQLPEHPLDQFRRRGQFLRAATARDCGAEPGVWFEILRHGFAGCSGLACWLAREIALDDLLVLRQDHLRPSRSAPGGRDVERPAGACFAGLGRRRIADADPLQAAVFQRGNRPGRQDLFLESPRRRGWRRRSRSLPRRPARESLRPGRA